MIQVTQNVAISELEIDLQAIRAQGSGGQNVNKVNSAIHLRFDIVASSLSEEVKARLIHSADNRVTENGVMIIKAQRFRTQEQNKDDAIERLVRWIANSLKQHKRRKPTSLSRAVKARRKESKRAHSQRKQQRQKVQY